MASGKATAKKPEDVDVGAAVDQVEKESTVAPNSSARPNDTPIVKPLHPNSTFADRAKKASKNKRVDADAVAAK